MEVKGMCCRQNISYSSFLPFFLSFFVFLFFLSFTPFPSLYFSFLFSFYLFLPSLSALYRLDVFIITGFSTTGSVNKQTDELKNSKFNFGYHGNGMHPGGVVYTVGGYYPAGAEGGYPGAAGKFCIALLINIISCHFLWLKFFFCMYEFIL
jgi:hypothetical protein